MHCMRSMRGGFIFGTRGPSLKMHHGQYFTSMTMHDANHDRDSDRDRDRGHDRSHLRF
jgi:hypothetical protein